jgi:1,4-dihydroxy-6-naphthoate synthase
MLLKLNRVIGKVAAPLGRPIRPTESGVHRAKGDAVVIAENKSLQQPPQSIRVGHSPDPDDAFMFYALAKGKIDTCPYAFTHELVDIETLNRRALEGELELTAVSVHAYAYLSDRYILCSCGASMGDQYGPLVVARREMSLDELSRLTIAVPGVRTTAFLALRLCLGVDFRHLIVPFDQILDAVEAGQYGGQPVDAGLIIHEGQLTYAEQQLKPIVDTGQWWYEQTRLPLPLGANAIRKNLGASAIRDVHRLLRESITFGLEHRDEALSYAMSFGRGLNRAKADQFVEMYVNQWTLDFGARGREAVARLLAEGYQAGVIPHLIVPEFVE